MEDFPSLPFYIKFVVATQEACNVFLPGVLSISSGVDTV